MSPLGTVLLPLHRRSAGVARAAWVVGWVVPALFQVDPIGAYLRHTVDPLFNLLVPR